MDLVKNDLSRRGGGGGVSAHTDPSGCIWGALGAPPHPTPEKLTHFTSRTISDPRYSMDLKISVVITRQDASGLIVTSPVMSPTLGNSSLKSRYFWFDSALIGEV